MSPRILRALGLLAALLGPGTVSGCCCIDESTADSPAGTNTPARQDHAPEVTDVLIPSWPPVGPGTLISASASDVDGDLEEITFDFRELVHVPAQGSSDEVSVSGVQLGEGYGALYVTAWDLGGGWADQEVTDFLVDLSPPKGALVTRSFARGPGQDIDLWVSDAWVLGGVELSFGGVSRSFTFAEGYPSTLGETWDSSLVHFASTDFPEASGSATLRVWDAAGNQTTVVEALTLDGTPPVVEIVAPAAGSTLGDTVTVEVTGADETDDAVSIDVLVGGSPVTTLLGPAGAVEVDLTGLVKGATTIEAVAHDAAGNSSVVASVEVVLE